MSDTSGCTEVSREPPTPPLSSVLLDYELIRSAKRGSGTFVDFAPGEHPRRCLDLACGVRHCL